MLIEARIDSHGPQYIQGIIFWSHERATMCTFRHIGHLAATVFRSRMFLALRANASFRFASIRQTAQQYVCFPIMCRLGINTFSQFGQTCSGMLSIIRPCVFPHFLQNRCRFRWVGYGTKDAPQFLFSHILIMASGFFFFILKTSLLARQKSF
jgi:hypothetical protein